MELNNKVAIITGAAQGIGKAIAIELAKAGAKVIVNDINARKGKRLANQITRTGQTAIFIRANVSRGREVQKMVRSVAKRFGRIDILINNAGISPKRKGGERLQIKDIKEGEWEKVFDVNLKGVFNCSKAVMKIMMKQKAGKIINIASIAGLVGGSLSFSGAHYAASKAGVLSLTKILAMELGPYGINVNAIAPGRIKTEMTKMSLPQVEKIFKKKIPLGRFGEPEEIAKAVTFLLSDSAAFIAGETLVVDGGVSMH